ncbi:MAG TPA: BamA/TamA family outer membrane protein [Gemmatimonadales bacterium]
MRSLPGPGLAVLWVLLVAGLGSAPLAAQQRAAAVREIERPEVLDLDFRGVEAVDEDELENSISTAASSCNSPIYRFTLCLVTKSPAVYTRRYLDREELARDVLRVRVFYWRRGYRGAQVDTVVAERGDDGVAVTFLVNEGEPTLVDTAVIAGIDSIIGAEERARLLLLEPGEPFSILALDSSLVRVRDALWDEGYADAVIDTTVVVDTASRLATITIEADPRWQARIGSVSVRGLERLEPKTVRNSLTIEEGEVFRLREVLRSQRNLYESNLFRSATFDVAGEDSIKSVAITVREGDIQSVRLSGGFSTVDYVQVEGRYTHRNFLGDARRLQFSAAVGNLFASALEDEFIFKRIPDDELGGDRSPFLRPSWQASIELRQPWFRSPLNTVTVGAFANRRTTPNVVVDRGQGVTATFNRQFAPRANLGGSYRFEVTRVQAGDVYFCVNFGVCDPITIEAVSAAQRLSPLAITGTIDRADDPLSPTRGYNLRLDLEHASAVTASDFRYNRAITEGALYRGLAGGVLAGHVRLGWARALSSSAEALGIPDLSDQGTLHPRKRFYAGGSRSVRGFAENQLGPRVLTIAPSKLRGLTVTEGENGAPPDTSYACAPSTPITQCDLSAATLDDDAFFQRPVGATTLAEASVEFRRQIWGPVVGAVFVDGAILGPGETGLVRFEGSFMAITPGIGIRYISPVGPIRVDIGYNPSGAEPLPVLTQIEVDDQLRLVQVIGTGTEADPQVRDYDPFGGSSGFKSFLRRLTLHLSIGEAF